VLANSSLTLRKWSAASTFVRLPEPSRSPGLPYASTESAVNAGVPMFSSEMLAQMIRFYGNALQGIMGNYMEQNVKAFLTIQNKLQEQAKQIYGDKMMLTPDLWKQFLQMQAPAMQGMLGNYLEQSAKLFMDMQQRMQDQTRGLFNAFPFPNFGAPQSGSDDDKKR